MFPDRRPVWLFFKVSSLSLLLFSVGFDVAVSNQARSMPDCLYSKSGARFKPKEHPECHSDVLNISAVNEIKKTEIFLDLNAEHVRFIGCSAALFMTDPGEDDPTVYYPATDEKRVNPQLVAPLIHELGHVYQLKRWGSAAKVREASRDSKERIELGADFIAGIVA
jgi:hypothetical protein